MKYAIIEAFSEQAINIKVNTLARDGWTLVGPVSASSVTTDDALVTTTCFVATLEKQVALAMSGKEVE